MPTTRRTILRALVGLALAAGTTPAVAQNVADLQVTPEALTLKVGQTQSLFPQAFDGAGNIIGTAKFVYRSHRATIARVDADGKVSGVTAGTTTIEVRAGRKVVSVPVLVTPGEQPAAPAQEAASPPTPAPRQAQAVALPPPPAGTASIVIDPATIYLLQAENDRLAARALGGDGSVLGPARVIWRSLTPDVVTITDSLNGDVVGQAPGVGTVQAVTSTGLVATAPVQVVATTTPFGFAEPRIVLSPDQVDTLVVVVPSQSGRQIQAALTYASNNANVVTVGPTGIMQAKGPGQTDIVVKGYFQEHTIHVVVHRPIAYFITDPASGGQTTVPLDGFRSLTAKAQAADSTPIPDAPLVWKVADTAVARYDTATGRVYGRKEGTTTLTLSVRGYLPKVWGLRVVPGGLALDHHRIGLVLGGSTAFEAHLRDGQGGDFGPAPEVHWATDHPDVVAVTDGKVVALAPGRAEVVASVPWGKADTATVFVTGDLLLTSDHRFHGVPGIYQVSLRSPGNLYPLITDSAAYADPVLSPDRMHIAFARWAPGTNYDIWVADADGRNARRVSADSAAEILPAWTPDGKSLVFTEVDRDDRSGLIQVNVDGTGRHGLTMPKISGDAPAVSPDGKWVAYVGGKDRRKPDVFLRALDRDSTVAITETKQKETAVAWFPNGDLAYLTEAPDGNKGYAVIRLAAATRQKFIVATSAYPITGFAISRDGATVAYVALEPNQGNKQQRTKTVLYLQSTTPGTAPQAVPLPTDETVDAPAF